MDIDMPINDVYLKYVIPSKARVIVLFGGADSGKSYFVGAQYIPLAMMSKDYFRGMLVRKYATSIRNSVFTEVIDGISNLDEVSNNFTPLTSTYEIKYKQNKNKILCSGLDKIPKLKSIKGLNFIWVEEAEEITETEYDNLLLRLRGGGYERLILTYNPVDEMHFTNKRFNKVNKKVLEYNEWGDPKVWTIDVTEEIEGETISYDILVVRTTYKDNRFISPFRKLAIESLQKTNPELWEILARGKYVAAGEVIFRNWEVKHLEDEEIEAMDHIRHGLDWGYYPDPFRYLKVNIDIKRKIIHIIREVNLLEATNEKAMRMIKPYLEPNYYPITADSAEPKSIKEFQNNGFRINGAKKGPGSVDTGNKKIQEFKIIINDECTGSIKDFSFYKRKKDKDGNITSEPIDAFNHSPDILRYILEKFTITPSAVMVKGLK